MPNYCDNILTVYGPTKDVFDFCNKHCRVPQHWNKVAKENESPTTLDFSVCAPYPEVRSEGGWYGWHIANWGTKWNAFEICFDTLNDVLESIVTDEESNRSSITYTFVTAWTPPEQWLESVSRAYKSLTFSLGYSEPAMDFAGVFEAHDGDVVSLDEFEPSSLVDLGDVDWEDDDQQQVLWEQQVTATQERLEKMMAQA